MPFEIVGKTTFQRGKTLWEILGNLKNHGVGRIVVRNQFASRHSEPSWYRILEVRTLSPEGKIQVIPPLLDLGEVRRVNALAEKVFRGKYYGQEWLGPLSYKPDFRLIPIEEEEIYTQVKKGELPEKFMKTDIYPSECAFPPLLRELVIRDLKARQEFTDEPKMKLVYDNANIRVKEEGETPTIQISPDYIHGTLNPSLYSTVKRS